MYVTCVGKLSSSSSARLLCVQCLGRGGSGPDPLQPCCESFREQSSAAAVGAGKSQGGEPCPGSRLRASHHTAQTRLGSAASPPTGTHQLIPKQNKTHFCLFPAEKDDVKIKNYLLL